VQYSSLKRRLLTFNLLKITNCVRCFVGNADDINRTAANQIKDHMLALGKAVVAFANIEKKGSE
jgi:hypothetical protein